MKGGRPRGWPSRRREKATACRGFFAGPMKGMPPAPRLKYRVCCDNLRSAFTHHLNKSEKGRLGYDTANYFHQELDVRPEHGVRACPDCGRRYRKHTESAATIRAFLLPFSCCTRYGFRGFSWFRSRFPTVQTVNSKAPSRWPKSRNPLAPAWPRRRSAARSMASWSTRATRSRRTPNSPSSRPRTPTGWS